MPLQPGTQAPDLQLPSHTREPLSLAEYRGQQALVVLFFPLAFTSTCTQELCTVGEDLRAYQELNAKVVAVSVDSPWVLERYREECGADFPFLSDFNRQAIQAFDVRRTEPLGPGLRDVAERSVFVIDPQGRIAYTWCSTDPSRLPPFPEIKQAIRAATAG